MKAHALSFLLLAFAGLAHAGSCGNGCGGGGSLCQDSKLNHGNPVLLDIALADPGFVDSSARSTQLTTSRNVQKLGVDYVDLQDSAPYKLALERIRKWKTTSPNSMEAVEAALSSIAFLKSNVSVGQAYKASIPSGSVCAGNHSTTVVTYGKNRNALISIPKWNSLGLKSQAGMLIHEALRYVQIDAGKDGSDSDLQALAAKIVLKDPLPYENLDHDEFFQAKIESDKLTAARKNLCQSLTGLESNAGLTLNDDERKKRAWVCSNSELTAAPTVTGALDLVKALNTLYRTCSRADSKDMILSTMGSAQDFLNVASALGLESEDHSYQLASGDLTKGDYKSRLQKTFADYEDYTKNPESFSGASLQQMKDLESYCQSSFKSE
jgi:hypothetical protein